MGKGVSVVARTTAQARPQNLGHTIRRLLSYMGHARLSLLAVAVLVSIAALANLCGTYMVRPVVNALSEGRGDDLPGLIAFTVVVYVIGVFASFGYTQTMVRAAQKVVFDIRRDLFAHIQKLPLSFFDRTRTGDVMSYFTNDVDTVAEALNNSFANVIQAFIQMVGTLIVLFVLNWQLTLITVACNLVIALYVRFSGGRSKMFFSRQQNALGALDGYIEEMVAGQKVVKVFNHEAANVREFTDRNEELRQAGASAQAYAFTMVPTTVCIGYVNYTIVAVVGALLAVNGMADVGALATPATDYYLKLKKQSPDIYRLLMEPVIIREQGSGTKKAADRYLDELNIHRQQLNVVAQINDLESIKQMITAGMGVSILSRFSIADLESRGQLIVYPIESAIKRQFYISYMKSHSLPPALQEFIAFTLRFYKS